MKALDLELQLNLKDGWVVNENCCYHVLPSKSNHKVTLCTGDMTYKAGRTSGVHNCKPERTNQRQLLTKLAGNKRSTQGCIM